MNLEQLTIQLTNKPKSLAMRKLTILLVLLLLGGIQVVLAQKTITGMVTSKEDGSSIPGATVVVTGTTIGTTTDISGKFTLSVPNDAISLHITYVGMKPIDVEIGTSKEISVSLESEAVSLDEVVVVGYGTQKKRDLTGAISSVKTNDIIISSNSDIGHTLKGKAAGLMVRENSAQPGGGLDILVRGAGSINASNAPLFVVDGFPIADLQQPDNGTRYDAGTQSILNTFNPNDIESIEVLKDASATAIYGARAAHGVILITTKRGKEGKPVIQYSTSYAIQKYNDSFDVLPLNEWMQVRNEAAWEQWNFENNVIPYGNKTLEEAKANPVSGDFYKLYTQNAIDNVGAGTDWLALTTQNGGIQQHNLSISGGNKSTKYLLSGNYFNQDGVIKNSGFQRYSFRANIDQDLSKYFRVGVNFSFSRINNQNSSLGGDQYENSGIIRASIQQGPHIQAIDENGNYPLNPQLSQQPNPYSLLTITDEGRVERTMLNSYLDFMPVKDLVIKLKAGLDRGITNRWTYLPKTTLAGQLENGKATIANTDKNNYLVEATANYSKRLGDNHQFVVLAGISEEKFVDRYNSEGNTNFISDAFLWNNLNAGTGTKSVGSAGTDNVMASYFGRLNYIFKDRYLMTLTLRTDGASVFAENNKWATFPSVALGWNIADESFFAGAKDVVSMLKLRLSYGQTGNASIGSNAFASYTAYPAYLTGDEVKNIGVSLSRLENPDLKWETTTELNLGVDFSLFKDRLSGSFELFSRVISDLLAMKPINSYNEINEVMANVGETQSKGFELSLTTYNMNKNDFEWKTMFTFASYHDNWRKRADDWKPAVYESETDPIRAIYSRVSDGIMQVGDVVPAQPELKPGAIKIADINGYVRDADGNPTVDENGRFLRTGAPDGIIDDADTKLLGTSDPKLIAGMSNMFRYKNFDLSFDFNGMFGRQMSDPNYTAYGVSAEGIYTYGYNGLRTVKDRWTPEKPSTTHPGSYYGWSPYGQGDFFLQKAWFIRMQNITFGYNLPKKWVGKVLSQANVHIDAQNLFVITPYTGVDPETDSYTAAYPYVRTFTLGLNIIF
jgi:TonB-linked SusC/RagA family outer membrane protein